VPPSVAEPRAVTGAELIDGTDALDKLTTIVYGELPVNEAYMTSPSRKAIVPDSSVLPFAPI
jgi:hypothetical protein